MTWKAFHNRGETLRSVIATSAVRRDGRLPMDVDRVSAALRGPHPLLAPRARNWPNRLYGQIERMLSFHPMDLDEAVAIAWSNTAHELPGVRLIIDHYRAHPIDDAMAQAMAVARFKEHHLLAVMAGRTSIGDESADRIGGEIEERARLLHRGMPMITPDAAYAEPEVRGSLLERLRAVVAA